MAGVALLIFFGGMHTLPSALEAIPVKVPIDLTRANMQSATFTAAYSGHYYVGIESDTMEDSPVPLLMPDDELKFGSSNRTVRSDSAEIAIDSPTAFPAEERIGGNYTSSGSMRSFLRVKAVKGQVFHLTFSILEEIDSPPTPNAYFEVALDADKVFPLGRIMLIVFITEIVGVFSFLFLAAALFNFLRSLFPPRKPPAGDAAK